MKILYTVGILSLFLLANQSSFGEKPTTNNYVKIIIKGVDTSQDAQNIDSFIRLQSGIIMSRMDYRTNIYFGLYNNSSGISINDYKNWITSLGFEMKCFYTDVHGDKHVVQLKESDCTEDTLIQNFNNN